MHASVSQIATQMGRTASRCDIIRGGMDKYLTPMGPSKLNVNPIFEIGPLEPRYSEWLVFEGVSVDESGVQYTIAVSMVVHISRLDFKLPVFPRWTLFIGMDGNACDAFQPGLAAQPALRMPHATSELVCLPHIIRSPAAQLS